MVIKNRTEMTMQTLADSVDKFLVFKIIRIQHNSTANLVQEASVYF
jgi:hypothetical protein